MRKTAMLLSGFLVLTAVGAAGGMQMPPQDQATNDRVAASVDRPLKNQVTLAVYDLSDFLSTYIGLFPTRKELLSSSGTESGEVTVIGEDTSGDNAIHTVGGSDT